MRAAHCVPATQPDEAGPGGGSVAAAGGRCGRARLQHRSGGPWARVCHGSSTRSDGVGLSRAYGSTLPGFSRSRQCHVHPSRREARLRRVREGVGRRGRRGDRLRAVHSLVVHGDDAWSGRSTAPNAIRRETYLWRWDQWPVYPVRRRNYGDAGRYPASNGESLMRLTSSDVADSNPGSARDDRSMRILEETVAILAIVAAVILTLLR